ncbi:Mannan synthase 1 [Acorus calamus]|uniref:Mannan synthase 1 n=1 Tax=Acorus calamus TaxID=4465 RepID=A0AAV9ELY2_ACOCL|nr:Mannan synthase 1 [Acorus calamus]
MRGLVLGDPAAVVGVGGGDGVAAENLRLLWKQARAPVVVPLLQGAVYVCAAMSVMLFMERVYMAVVILSVKLLRKKKYTKYGLEAMKEDLENNNNHPVILVQIPMYNEKEVYRLSIGAACGLSWPPDRIIIQVLDDSTDPFIKELVQLECQRWAAKGVNIKYEIRSNRNGYKAGALREGLKKPYVKECNYVAIFDADFQPEADYLWRTVPFLLENPELALVQARWKFGTAGVWRLQAINDAGGWKDRTTVEDMDLAVRASLKGWKFVFVGDLSVKNELPSTYKAYRYQQHRWSCGPANLFRKMLKEIIFSERVSMLKKFHVIYAFFFVRKIVAHLVTFFFYCVIIPTCVLVPEIRLPKLVAVYIPFTITILNAICTPRSVHLLIFWILFENVMSMHRAKATIIGLLEANRVNEWVVTEKLGNAGKQKAASKLSKKPRFHIGERFHVMEVLMGSYLFYCAIYNVCLGRDHFYIYLFLQAAAFFIMGFGYDFN